MPTGCVALAGSDRVRNTGLGLAVSQATADCLSFAATCPDLVFSDGSTRTVAGVEACAETFKTFSCERLQNGETPDCATPGTRQTGQSCEFASQCASLECKGSGSCGLCAKPGAEGDSCPAADAGCASGLQCFDSSHSCELTGGSTLTSKFDGKTCTGNADRGLAGYCQSATHTCKHYPSVGGSCAESRECDPLAWCNHSTGLCQAFQAEGEPCGMDAVTTANPYCQAGADLICDQRTPTSGTCVKFPAIGERCPLDEQGNPVEKCAVGAHCDTSLKPAQCVAAGAAGASCSLTVECEPGAVCGCPSPGGSCASNVCLTLNRAGQPCGGSSKAVCHPGFECVTGTCQPIDSRGLFKAMCGGSP